ncbi:hypothetical protein JTE90_016279 [Oedothorax gibbosus]|uniref:Uncharacterized protein n=1 Tax=Oedothorax gibbosus TaxID=931172 RepID=A0AAV6TVN1_9ARAC|nr:hypothetical protein JTE90_016279 [Oedothorax gibbosus]
MVSILRANPSLSRHFSLNVAEKKKLKKKAEERQIITSMSQLLNHLHKQICCRRSVNSPVPIRHVTFTSHSRQDERHLDFPRDREKKKERREKSWGERGRCADRLHRFVAGRKSFEMRGVRRGLRFA